MSRNPIEQARRALKVEHLIAALARLPEPQTADDVAAFSSGTWNDLTKFANALFGASHDPPSAASRAMVVEALREMERVARVLPSNVRSLAEARARRAS